MSDYHINIFFSDEDGGYIADLPDLEACSAFGHTTAEALAELQVAKAAWLDANRANGHTPPAPRYRPAIYPVRAGRGSVAAVPSAVQWPDHDGHDLH